MNVVAIKVDHVSKKFLLPHEKVGSVKSIFTNVIKYMSSTKTYDTQVALRDVSFEVKKGEFFGIVGRNGSGKSTLLKMLAGIYQPSRGKIAVNGKLVPFIELGVGFNPELTGRQNVYLNGALLGFAKEEIDKQYDDIVEFAELERFMDQKLKNYSSGMQVRLAFSMAVRADAEVLLIDEVLAVGDADFQRKCFDYFKKLKRTKTTVVFVTHDMEAVREYCDRAMLVEQNEIKLIGDTDKVSQAYLKLFNKEEANDNTADQGTRWGDGRLSIETVDVVTRQDSLKISYIIKATQDVDGFIAGIRIKSTSGQYVTGTNTKIEHLPHRKLKAGESLPITWEVPNIFSDGEYFVDPALLATDSITVHDWWDDAVRFTIKKDRKLPYIADPSFKVYFEKQ